MEKLFCGLLIILVLYLIFRRCSSGEKYRFLGGISDPRRGGYRAEMNEECLRLQAGQQCILTDGTSGNCVQSGHCVENMLVDLNLENQEIEKPYCTKPVFKEGCGRFCECKQMQGTVGPTLEDSTACLKNCLSYFSPL